MESQGRNPNEARPKFEVQNPGAHADSTTGVRPFPGAATSATPARPNPPAPSCFPRCCARGRAHSGSKCLALKPLSLGLRISDLPSYREHQQQQQRNKDIDQIRLDASGLQGAHSA